MPATAVQAPAPTSAIPADVVALQLLSALGAPQTRENVAAVRAWLASESGIRGGNVQVAGNNPLNISTGADVSGKVVGTRRVGPGIAVYPDLGTGIAATAQYLQHSQPGIVRGLQAGNGTAAVQAITASNFVTGGSGGNQYRGALMGRYTAQLGQVGTIAWAGLVDFPTGHVLTQADVDQIIAKLRDAGYFGGTPIASQAAEAKARQVLESGIGQAWDPSFLARAQQAFLGTAASTPGAGLSIPNPLAFGQQAAAFVADPQNWISLGALVVGTVAILAGAAILMRSTASEAMGLPA